MSGLHPTRTRLALLRDVAGEWCYRSTERGDRNAYADRRINAAIAELERAGWVELGRPPSLGRLRRWRLTDAGRDVLDAHTPDAPGGAS